MPATKDDFLAWDARALTGGAAAVATGYQDCQESYGGVWQIKVANGATRQTRGVKVQCEIAPDQVAGNTYPFDCAFVADEEASAVSKVAIRIPPECKFSRLVATPGDQDATITAIFTRLTQV